MSVAEAVDRMAAIEAALPASDGLACFNRMYLQVTRLVGERLTAGYVADPAFLDALDVCFANRYLAAADAAGDGSAPLPAGVPRCWAALLERRTDQRVAAIQFALAGMNAHINHDLPLAVVQACEQLGTAPDEGSHHADYDRVNALLAGVEQEVRRSFEAGIVRSVDSQIGPLETVLGNWSIEAARDAAWVTTEALWELRRLPTLQARYLEGLDRLVGFAGRGLLIPTADPTGTAVPTGAQP
ncbi:MAG: DUF5995 family protein [Mycobacteriales bacterium]